jgi:hypothetical protein
LFLLRFIFKNPAISSHFARSRQSPVHHTSIRQILARFTARVLLRPGLSHCSHVFLDFSPFAFWQGVTFSFPGICRIIVKFKFCIFMTSLLIIGGNLAWGLLKSSKRCLWSVASWKCLPPSRYIYRCDVVNSAARVSRFIWVYLLSVSVSVRLT